MLAFSRNILLLSLFISAITASLVYLTLSWVIVRPMRRLTRAMVSFAEDPENRSRIIAPSDRTDEIGVAERELAAMQAQLVGTLQQKTHLAALGLAVSKINHDLRNLLSAAQLFSDRLVGSGDPMVQRFAPKLLETLDRAIAFCQSTLSYGKAVELPPERRLVAVAPLVDDARELLGLGGEERVGWIESIEPGLTIDADPDQLSRVLLNLARNALQALQAKGETDPAIDQIRVSGRREGANVVIEISDTGPGVPERARQRLFEAFSGSARSGGTGLGLAIAAELVRLHGGTLCLVEGTIGATFRIVIPDRGSPVR
jgi:signal transduction histidine kinase